MAGPAIYVKTHYSNLSIGGFWMSSAAPKTVQRTPFKRWCDENTGLFFLIPWILGFLIFKAYPFASSLVYSFTDLNFFKGISQ